LTLGRRLRLLLIAAVVLAAVLVYFNERRPAASVTEVAVARENLSTDISSNGKVEPVTPYDIRAEADAFVKRLNVIEGQQVKKGQLLLELDDTQIQSELAQAQSELSSEQDALRAAQGGGRADQAAKLAGDLQKATAQRDELQRQNAALEKLVAQQAATPEELEQNRVALANATAEVNELTQAQAEFKRQAQIQVEQLGLQVEHSRAQIADLQAKLNAARPVAPADGTLYSLPVHVGDFVHEGDPLAAIADLHNLRVRAYIDEPELGQLEPNQDVEITWDAKPDRVWKGHVEMVPKQVVAHGTRSVGETLCSVTNDKLELIPNITVDVHIHVQERPNALVVPRGAVQIDGTHHYVYLIDGDRLHRREITVGMTTPVAYEVLGGVEEGDEVALPGDVAPKDEMRVKVVVVNPE
jgi:HlyD family secretion protein